MNALVPTAVPKLPFLVPLDVTITPNGDGLSLLALLAAGQAGELPMFLPLMGHSVRGVLSHRGARIRPELNLRRHGILIPRDPRAAACARGIKTMIPEPSDQQGTPHARQFPPRASLIMPDTADGKNRNLIERRPCHIKQRWELAVHS